MKNKKKLVSIIAASSIVVVGIQTIPAYAAPSTGKVRTAEESIKAVESHKSESTNTTIGLVKGSEGFTDPNREIHMEKGGWEQFSRYTHEDGTPYTGLYKSRGQWLVLDKDGFNRRHKENPQSAWINGLYVIDFIFGVGPNKSPENGKYYLGKTTFIENASVNYNVIDNWVSDGGEYYRSNAEGICYQNAWFKDTTGKWYYFGDDFKMVRNTTIDGYKIGKDGVWEN